MTPGQDESGGSARAPSFPAFLLITIWLAFVAAAAELLVVGIRKGLFHEVLRISRQIVWLAPVGELMLLLPPALLLWLVGRVWRPAGSLRALVLVLGFLGGLGVLLFAGFLHDIAILVLAAGCAWQAARAAAREPARFIRLARRTTPALALVFVALAGVVNGKIALDERQAVRALPAAPANAPNVLLIIWDTVRGASLSLLGHDRPTSPNLEALAATGVTFERAIATAPWTLPSHASMLTGAYPHRTSASWTTPLDDALPTLAEVLARRGYATGAFAANVLYVQWENGLDRGFSRFEDYRVTPGQALMSTGLGRRLITGRFGWETGMAVRLLDYRQFVGRKLGAQVNEDFLEWRDDAGDRPWFAMLNYFDAHLPYVPPEPFAGRFGVPRPQTSLLDRIRREYERDGFWDMPAPELAAEVAAYEESIAYMDAQLDVLIDSLDAHGELDNTLIIVTSDHGEEFGEHGDFEHGTNLYMEQLHVPLVVSMPGEVPAGVRVTEPVSIAAIPATVMQLIGERADTTFAAVPLTEAWKEGVATAPALAELTPGLSPTQRMRALVLDELHYIRNPDGGEELYDWAADPAEQFDLAAEARLAPRREGLSALLDYALECRGFDCARRTVGPLR
jgi:arylsulfatase A-like enzyme